MMTTASAQSNVTASHYADKYQGRMTANGTRFNQDSMTAASNVYPLNTIVKVKNPLNLKEVTVRITDRLHPKYRNRIDLSKAAFKALDDLKKGLIKVIVEI